MAGCAEGEPNVGPSRWEVGCLDIQTMNQVMNRTECDRRYRMIGNATDMKKQITNVVFDVGGVLTDYHQIDYFEQLGYAPDMAKALTAATQKSPDWIEYDRGVLTDEEVRARFKKRTPSLAREIDESLTHMPGMVTARETAIPWVRSLKERGIHTYVLSNFSATCYRECHDALSFEPLMDGCLWSFQQKVIKPDDAAFLLLLHMFQLTPSKTVFIDDTPANVQAAEKLGINGILFTNQKDVEAKLEQLLT